MISYDGALSYRLSAFFIRLTIRELNESYVCKTMGRKRTNTSREISHDPAKVEAACINLLGLMARRVGGGVQV